MVPRLVPTFGGDRIHKTDCVDQSLVEAPDSTSDRIRAKNGLCCGCVSNARNGERNGCHSREMDDWLAKPTRGIVFVGEI